MKIEKWGYGFIKIIIYDENNIKYAVIIFDGDETIEEYQLIADYIKGKADYRIAEGMPIIHCYDILDKIRNGEWNDV